MEEAMKSIRQGIADICSNVYQFLTGLMASFFGYFLPVKNIVHLIILFFILDVIFGAWAAKKVKKEKFSVKIIWNHTMPRMLISIILVMGAYMWDSVFSQDFVSTYKIIGWFISGVLLWSVAENGYKITKWSVFPKLGDLFRSKVQEQTGMDVSDEKPKKDGQENN
jgi:hypothetical protein